MACEVGARNRMLRKRWVVRNPVVGEDDITQFILARLFNTSWPRGLFSRDFLGITDTFHPKQDLYTYQTWSQIDARGVVVLFV